MEKAIKVINKIQKEGLIKKYAANIQTEGQGKNNKNFR